MNGSCFFFWYIVCISHKLQEIFSYNLYVCCKERKMYCMKKKRWKKNDFGNEELELNFEITGATFSNIERPEQSLKQNIFSIFLLEVPIRSNTLEPQYTVIGTNKMPILTNNWDVETNRNELKCN